MKQEHVLKSEMVMVNTNLEGSKIEIIFKIIHKHLHPARFNHCIELRMRKTVNYFTLISLSFHSFFRSRVLAFLALGWANQLITYSLSQSVNAKGVHLVWLPTQLLLKHNYKCTENQRAINYKPNNPILGLYSEFINWYFSRVLVNLVNKIDKKAPMHCF